MSKVLTLTIGERIGAVKILNEFKGDLSTLADLLEDVKKFTVTDEEWTEAHLLKTPNADGSETWKWDEGFIKEIDLNDKTTDYLTKKITEKSEAGEITFEDAALSTLNAKLA